MFCKECGNELKDGSMFCGKCGTKVVSESAENEVSEDATVPMEEAPVEETPVEEAPVEETSQSSAPQVAPKKKKFPKVLAIVAAVVLILGGGFLLFKDAIMNKMMDFRSAETRLQYAYSNSAKEWGEFTGEVVTEVSKITDTSEGTATAIFSIRIGEGIKTILEESSGVDLGEIDTVYVSCEVAFEEDKLYYDIAIGLQEAKLLSVNVVADLEEGLIALSIPELSDTAIEIAFATDVEFDMEEFATIMSQKDVYMQMLEDILPDEELIEDMVPRYVEAIIKAMADVKSESATLEVEGVSQKATAYTVNFNADTVRRIGEEIANAVKEDEELEAYLKEFCTTWLFAVDIESDKVWENTYKQLTGAIEKVFDEFAEYFELNIAIVTWVDSDYEIIGFEVPDYFQFLSAKDGKDVATKLVLTEPGQGEMVKLAIVGQESGDEFAGDITFYMEEEEIITIKVDKYVSTDDEFVLDASITIPTDMVEELIGMKNPLGAVTLKIQISATEEEADVTLKLVIAGSEWMALNYKATSDDEADITYPKDTMGVDEIEEWMSTIDFSDLIDNLDELGILDMLGVDKKMFEQAIDQLIKNFDDLSFGQDNYY